jgi:hypothetical protein
MMDDGAVREIVPLYPGCEINPAEQVWAVAMGQMLP